MEVWYSIVCLCFFVFFILFWYVVHDLVAACCKILTNHLWVHFSKYILLNAHHADKSRWNKASYSNTLHKQSPCDQAQVADTLLDEMNIPGKGRMLLWNNWGIRQLGRGADMENITSATGMFLENFQGFGKLVALNISCFVKNLLFTACYPLFG